MFTAPRPSNTTHPDITTLYFPRPRRQTWRHPHHNWTRGILHQIIAIARAQTSRTHTQEPHRPRHKASDLPELYNTPHTNRRKTLTVCTVPLNCHSPCRNHTTTYREFNILFFNVRYPPLDDQKLSKKQSSLPPSPHPLWTTSCIFDVQFMFNHNFALKDYEP